MAALLVFNAVPTALCQWSIPPELLSWALAGRTALTMPCMDGKIE